MSPGPGKSFDPSHALVQARDVFWRRGYDGTAIRDLEMALGIGRKSLYDTFGSKRELYLRALEQYTDSVIERICRGLGNPRHSALSNLERVLGRLQQHHSSPGSVGCLLGVAMAQADSTDTELAALLRSYLQRLEDAFESTIHEAVRDGSIKPGIRPKDAARHFVALTQGIALMGRVCDKASLPRSIVRSALQALQS